MASFAFSFFVAEDSNADRRGAFVPDLVTTLTTAPAGAAVLGRVRFEFNWNSAPRPANWYGRASRSRPAERLAEERVVVVGAVDDDAVQCRADPRADVAGAGTSRVTARRQQHEVDEVRPFTGGSRRATSPTVD